MSDLKNDRSFDYGLPLERHFTQTNETDIRIVSIQGNYAQEGMAMEENYTHNCQAPPIPQINPGIK